MGVRTFIWSGSVDLKIRGGIDLKTGGSKF